MLEAITTSRLALVPMQPPDIEPLWRMLLLPDVRRYLCDDQLLPRAFVEGLAEQNRELAPSGLGLRIVRDAGGFAGFVAIKPVPEPVAACIPEFRGELEVSVALHPRCWGLGYANEAIAAALDDWRRNGDGRRVVAVADVPNTRSRRMLARLGFVETGEHGGSHYRLVSFLPAG
jgi:ribosomal-protein-alanine N-acetyltransferase